MSKTRDIESNLESRIKRVQSLIASLQEIASLETEILAIQARIEAGYEMSYIEKVAYQHALDMVHQLSGIPDPDDWPLRTEDSLFSQDTLLQLGLRELVLEICPLMEDSKERARYNDDSWNRSDCHGESGDGWLNSGC